MGLAVSQVRLLALTSRKADVEMQIQLNSKRKTMLTREATDLAKLYYAKLQNTKIQYSTTNGYKDVTYGYLMAQDTGAFFDQIVEPSSSSNIDTKASASMILTDIYGRVILSDAMLNVVVNVLNRDETPSGSTPAGGTDPVTGAELPVMTVEDYTLAAMSELLNLYSGESDSSLGVGTSQTAASLNSVFTDLYEGTAWENNTTLPISPKRPDIGEDVLKYLLRNGFQQGPTLYYDDAGGTGYYTDPKMTADSKVTPTDGTFYIIKNASDLSIIGSTEGASGVMYWSESTPDTSGVPYVPGLTTVHAKQLASMFSYYGSIFSAAFNGNRTWNETETIDGPGKQLSVKHFNAAAQLGQREMTNADGTTYTEYYVVNGGNSKYTTVSNVDNLQAGLKSGLYQLVNVTSPVTGGYAKAQGLDYFETQNYVVEKADSAARDTVTAWYDAARADLESKESYWDSEITALSSELNSITTEIDSVKKLREDAISATFKWGSA